MQSRSFADRIRLEDHFALELVTGTNMQGEDSYALLLLPAAKVDDLRRALATSDVKLDDFGRVLAKGAGHTPPDGVIDAVRRSLNPAA